VEFLVLRKMTYTIIYMKDDQKYGAAPWDGDINLAINWARIYLHVYEIDGGATSAVILDDEERVVFSIPEDMSPRK
jgi:hypothetical protein